jgi:hypothetical protein
VCCGAAGELSASGAVFRVMFGQLFARLRGRRTTFRFHPRWKEYIEVKGPGGCFAIEHTYGKAPKAYLPSPQDWQRIAPLWAIDLWPVLHDELSAWCGEQGITLEIDPSGRHQALGRC